MVEAASVSNLKATWTDEGRARDWRSASAQGAGVLASRHAGQEHLDALRLGEQGEGAPKSPRTAQRAADGGSLIRALRR